MKAEEAISALKDKIGLELDIRQIGIVVEDLEGTIAVFETAFSSTPWTIMEFTGDNMHDIVTDGVSAKEDYHFRIAAAMHGALQIELIEPNPTMPIYQRFYEENGRGIHHFKARVPNEEMDAVRARFASFGMPTMFGGFYHNVSFYYIDTQSILGFQLELGNCEKLELS